MATSPKGASAGPQSKASSAGTRLQYISPKERDAFADRVRPMIDAMTRAPGAAGQCEPDAAAALSTLGECKTTTELQQWEFMLVTLCYACHMNATKLARLWALNGGSAHGVYAVLEREVNNCWPFRAHFSRARSLRQFYDRSVLRAATPQWCERVLCNYQLLALFVDQMAGYVYLERASDEALPAELRTSTACSTLGHALAAVAARHASTMRLLARFVSQEPEFEALSGTPLSEWSAHDVDRLRAKGAEMLFTLKTPALIDMFAEPSRVRVPTDAAGRMLTTVRPVLLAMREQPPEAAAAALEGSPSGTAAAEPPRSPEADALFVGSNE